MKFIKAVSFSSAWYIAFYRLPILITQIPLSNLPRSSTHQTGRRNERRKSLMDGWTFSVCPIIWYFLFRWDETRYGIVGGESVQFSTTPYASVNMFRTSHFPFYLFFLCNFFSDPILDFLSHVCFRPIFKRLFLWFQFSFFFPQSSIFARSPIFLVFCENETELSKYVVSFFKN